MLQYQEIINKIGNPSIETISNNDVKIFHLTQSKGGITITDSGNAYTDEEFEKAQNGLIDFSDNFHAHDSFFLIYVLKGCNLEIVEGEPIMVTSNDLLMLTPYTQHHNVRTASSQVLFIHIDPVAHHLQGAPAAQYDIVQGMAPLLEALRPAVLLGRVVGQLHLHGG